MADTDKTETTGFKLPDPAEIGRSMADIAERSQRIVGEWLKRQASEEHPLDPLNIGSAFLEMTARMIANPAGLMAAQHGFNHSTDLACVRKRADCGRSRIMITIGSNPRIGILDHIAKSVRPSLLVTRRQMSKSSRPLQ